MDAIRKINLPLTKIKNAINAHFGGSDVIPEVDTGGSGRFVSNFMAYHVAWYREWWGVANSDASKKIHKSGHTHVGAKVTVTNDPGNDAEKAVDIQLDELFKVLPTP